MSETRKNPYEYCKEHKTISVRTAAGCPLCLQAANNALKKTVTWMLADLDFRNEGTDLPITDSPEVAKAREQIKGA